MNQIFGVDIGGTQIKIGAFSEDGSLLKKWAVETDLSESGSHIIPQVADEVRRYLTENGLTESAVKGIGMGIPGPVDKNGYVRTCVNLNWNAFNPVDELAKDFPDVHVCAGNDANVAALGEYWQGAGRNYESAMLITIGTGIGGGIVLDGKILLGAHGLAGEIGHIAADRNATERCNCGNLGCVDHIASASGIVRVMKELLSQSDEGSVLRKEKEITARAVCDAAAAADPLALRCIDTCMEVLARGMAWFSHAFDPEVFIIGGGVSQAGSIITDPLQKHYSENLFLIEKGADIRIAQLGNDAGIIGAGRLAMQERSTE